MSSERKSPLVSRDGLVVCTIAVICENSWLFSPNFPAVQLQTCMLLCIAINSVDVFFFVSVAAQMACHFFTD